ncbi:hypothetical protein AGOR_G00222170 [Albula goreensis]|uniref:Uncharacterized protein n=1 Tax=Albula goreensis TaxID=1534307 RepID=A0A8T3CG27_9TELE|nr:hypothetical protein AGOR_G00222170 [Albula goreensis]
MRAERVTDDKQQFAIACLRIRPYLTKYVHKVGLLLQETKEEPKSVSSGHSIAEPVLCKACSLWGGYNNIPLLT